jgi:hypothetical protein
MDASAAQDLLDDVKGLKRRARGDRRAASVPLLAFGGVALVDALLQLVLGPVTNLVSLLLAPVGFAAVAVYFRRREIATGIGSRSGPYSVAAIVTVVALLLVLGLILPAGMYAVVGVGLLVIAVRQRNLYLGLWAVFYGVVGGLEGLSLISNRLYAAFASLGWFRSSGGYFSWSPSLIYGLLGLVLIGAGVYALQHEVASR